MRRTSIVFVLLALLGSLLGAASSTASAVSLAGISYTGTDTGNFYVVPTTFFAGQKVQLTGNFGNDQAIKIITFYKETSPGSNDYTAVGTDEANSSGNAYLNDYQVNAEQRMFAMTPNGEVTEIHTLTPTEISPTTCTKTGVLTESPASFSVGSSITLKADFPSDQSAVNVTYFRQDGTAWTSIGVAKSDSSGVANLANYVVNSSQQIYAVTPAGQCTEVDTVSPTPAVDLSIRRDCTGNTCGATATAYGELNPAIEGRLFGLQSLSGSTWKPIGTKVATGADGKVQIPLSLTSLSQWSATTYRIVSDSVNGAPTITSPQIKFMPGPTSLGPNVLHVDVTKGVFPTSKSTEYTGDATASVNGVVNSKINKAALETFGVRGFSTAGYPKKPYKLKFDKSPKSTTVFGMDPDKSWTLLAMWLDRSFVRDKVALDLGRKMAPNIAWTPDSRYVELFVNDLYEGAYLMTESVKIDGDRVDVDPEQGVIMETDGSSVADSKLGFKSSHNQVLAFKDPDEYKTLDDGSVDPEGVTTAKLNAVRNRVNDFESKLYNASTREQYVDYLDAPSAIDFYFIREFTKERDGDMYRSNYFSWDPSLRPGKPLSDNRLHFGPAWDFDRSAGISGETDAIHKYVDSTSGWYLRGTGTNSGHPNYTSNWFVQLFKSSTFQSKVTARWAAAKSSFDAASQDARDAGAAVGVGALNDQKRWPDSRRYKDHGTFQDEIDFVANWYHGRYLWMNANL
jgi:hypothetical protein